MPATLTLDTARAILAANPDLGTIDDASDIDDADLANLKAAIRTHSDVKRVSADHVEQVVGFFAELAEADDDEGESEGRSVVKRTYKQRYRPFKSTCGDELAQLVAGHLKVKTEDGVRIDTDRLRKFATANDCWQPGYSNLNVGMQRMNVVNRLRAKVKKGHDIVWA